MCDGNGLFGLPQDTGPRIALRQTGRLVQRLAQQPALCFRL